MALIENMKQERVIPTRKLLFAEKLSSLLDEYDTCLIIEINNIGSKQIAEMRKEFHNRGRFLFGKNTLIRKVIRDYIKQTRNMKLLNLMDLIRGNCGLLFTKQDLQTTYKELIKIRKKCPAKLNTIAPSNVHLNVGPTNVEPTKFAIFQSMDIETRINRGQIDIISPKLFIKKGDKINASHTHLLSLLNIKPFWYGIKVKSIYDNGDTINDTSSLGIENDEIQNAFYSGLHQIAALCLALDHPTMIDIPHSVINAYRETLGLSIMLDSYSWDGLNAIENILEYAEIINNKHQIEKPQPTINDDPDDPDDPDDNYHGPFCQCRECGGSSSSEDESSSSEES